MALIALLVADSGHASTVNTQAALASLGHAAVVIPEGHLANQDFSRFDLAVALRMTVNSTHADNLRNRVIEDGIPLLLGTMQPGTAGTVSGMLAMATLMGLCGTQEQLDFSLGATEIQVSSTHPVNAGMTVGDRLAVYTAEDYWSVLDAGQTHLGTVLTHADPDVRPGAVEAFSIDAGTVASGTPLGAPVIVSGMVYGRVGYTAAGIDYLGRMISHLVPEVVPEGTIATLLPDAPQGRTGAIQTWVVPATDAYVLYARGASGGAAIDSSSTATIPGGAAAQVTGLFQLTAGDQIQVLLGKRGEDNQAGSRAGGGGGATYVYNATTATLLMVAGGGGGAGQYIEDILSSDASLTQDGRNGTRGTAGAGGIAGQGGDNGPYGAGGAGWLSDGQTASAIYATGGERWLPATPGTGEGGLRGTSYPTDSRAGGFGGGGGAWAGAGGGGGFSGGGGGGWSNSGSGGGGGSYVDSSALGRLSGLESAVYSTSAFYVSDQQPAAEALLTGTSTLIAEGDTPWLPPMYSPLGAATPGGMSDLVIKAPYYGPYIHELTSKGTQITDYSNLRMPYPPDVEVPGSELTNPGTLPEQVYD